MSRVAAALLVVATLGAAPASSALPYGPVPGGAQTALVKKYVEALHDADYDAAFALLTDDERRYYGTAAAYRSVFAADGIALQHAAVVGTRGDKRGRVYFVRERIAFVDHATDARREIEATVPIGVLPEHGTLHVKDPGKPYRAFASASAAEESGLRIAVKKVELYPDRITVVATFANLGDSFVTVLPYAKSVLRDDRGGVYRVRATKDWAVTDKALFEGVRLAPRSRYTGTLVFAATRLGDVKRAWSLTVAPALREAADAPFDVTIAIVPAP